MDLNIERNPSTGGQYTVFQHKGKYYYADRSPVLVGWTLDCVFETMIFNCDANGEVTDWSELYCDQTEKSLSTCVEEFISDMQ